MEAFQEQLLIYRDSQVVLTHSEFLWAHNNSQNICVRIWTEKQHTHIKKKAIFHWAQRISSRLQSIASSNCMISFSVFFAKAQSIKLSEIWFFVRSLDVIMVEMYLLMVDRVHSLDAGKRFLYANRIARFRKCRLISFFYIFEFDKNLLARRENEFLH